VAFEGATVQIQLFTVIKKRLGEFETVDPRRGFRVLRGTTMGDVVRERWSGRRLVEKIGRDFSRRVSSSLVDVSGIHTSDGVQEIEDIEGLVPEAKVLLLGRIPRSHLRQPGRGYARLDPEDDISAEQSPLPTECDLSIETRLPGVQYEASPQDSRC
jgi:hypothetical protein